MRRIAACVLFLSCVAGQASAEFFRFDMPPGPHAVGFRLVEQYDASRS